MQQLVSCFRCLLGNVCFRFVFLHQFVPIRGISPGLRPIFCRR
jgi:hypothetical protein